MTEVTEYLKKITPEQKKIIDPLRKKFLSCDLTEKIAWNALCFQYNDKHVCALTVTKEYVRLDFFKGKQLDDPKGLLCGTGKTVRNIKIYADTKISTLPLTSWVEQAKKLVL